MNVARAYVRNTPPVLVFLDTLRVFLVVASGAGGYFALRWLATACPWPAPLHRRLWTNPDVVAAGSFYLYGERHGTLHDSPKVGDAVVFNYVGGGVAEHVAIVSSVASDGKIETISGDWDGESGSEAHFASTSRVVHNTPAYNHDVGTEPGIMGMKISKYVSPVD